MTKMDSTETYTHSTGEEFRVGESVTVTGIRWRPDILNTEGTRFTDARYADTWDAEIVEITVPTDSSTEDDGQMVVSHIDEDMTSLTRDITDIVSENPDGSESDC